MIPRLVTEHALDYVATATRHLLREREAGYPRAVEAGKMTEDDAEHGLAVMRAVAAQWTWVIGDTPLPEWDAETLGHFGMSEAMLAAAIASDATRARYRAEDVPDDPKRRAWAAIFDALAWWQQFDMPRPIPRAIDLGQWLRQQRAFHAALRPTYRKAA